MTFPAYVMKTMSEPGDNPTHLVERVLSNLWASSAPNCAHVWIPALDITTGNWECAWVQKTEDQWDAFLREHDPRLDEVIEKTIKKLEKEANGE